MKADYRVAAIWDSEASVWVSETDIPGLVIEAGTLAEFDALMQVLVPDMLSANARIRGEIVRVEFTARVRRVFAVA